MKFTIPYPYELIDIADHVFHRLQRLLGFSDYLHLSRSILENFLPANGEFLLCAMVLHRLGQYVEESVSDEKEYSNVSNR